MRSLALWIGVSFVLVVAARAQQASPPDLTAEGNRLLAAGKPAEALAAYERAAELLPGSPELAYNRGVAEYRLGDYAKAAEFFGQALTPGDPALDAKARFNLGNCAYATGLTQQQSEPPEAIKKLEEAVGHYADALELTPDDRDARENIERAQRLVEELRKLQQQQKQQQNDQQQQDPNQPQEKQDQQKQQQGQQEQKDQEKKDQQQQEQQQKDQQNQDSQQNQQQSDSQDQQKQDQQQQQQQDQQQKDQQQQDQQQQQSADQQKDQQSDQQQAQQAQPVELKPMKPDEAERLLQSIRDKERQRREALARQQRQQAGNTPVERDW